MSMPVSCPKCHSTELIRAGGRRRQGYPAVRLSAWRSVPLSRHICSACGFTEEWVESQADLAKIRRKL